jgi:quercetin dioxygenase-like cupin family protein
MTLTDPTPPGPRVLQWQGCGPYRPILEGPPATRGLRSGCVTLGPGQDVGEHSTGAHEEIVIVLEGQGQACARGRDPLEVRAGQAVYVPPETWHNMRSAGDAPFRYIYVVAPAAGG